MHGRLLTSSLGDRRVVSRGGQRPVHRVEVEGVAGDLDARTALLPDGLDGAPAAADEPPGLDVGNEEAEGVGHAVRVAAGESHDRVGVGAHRSRVAEDVGEGELDGVEGACGGHHAVVRVIVEARAAVANGHLGTGDLVHRGSDFRGHSGGNGDDNGGTRAGGENAEGEQNNSLVERRCCCCCCRRRKRTNERALSSLWTLMVHGSTEGTLPYVSQN